MSKEPIQTKEQTEAMAELLGLEHPVPQVTESDFVNRYLPILTGQSSLPVSTWISEVAGLPQNQVEVVDTSGNVVVTVPALLRDIDFKEITHESQHVRNIFIDGELRANVLPGKGIKYVDAALKDKIDPKGIHVEAVKQWNFILERYGYPLIGNVGAEETLRSSQANDNPPDILGYDEL